MKGTNYLIIALLGWCLFSSWWYVCKIKGICSNKQTASTQTNELVINLEDNQAIFDVTTSSDGTVQFQNRKAGESVGMLISYLRDNPNKNIHISGKNQTVLETLRSTFEFSGIDAERYDIDLTKQKQTSAIAIDNPNFVEPNLVTEIVDEDTVDKSNKIYQVKNSAPTANKTNTAKITSIPCPKVLINDGYPTIGHVQYSTKSSKSYCNSALKKYAKAANAYLNAHGGKIVITGHTDGEKKAVNNLSLGLKRAVEIKKHLMQYGVPPSKIETYSKGETEPIGDNATFEGRQKNRRVSIELIN